MSKWVDGFIAGAGALALGVLIGQSGKSHKKHFHRRRHFTRSRRNPGWRQRQLEVEILAFLREARETLAVMNNPKTDSIDAEFIVPPNPANASPTSQEPAPEVTIKCPGYVPSNRIDEIPCKFCGLQQHDPIHDAARST